MGDLGNILKMGSAAVDNIEDTKSQEFNKAQQSSTRCPHLVEIEAAENRAFFREAGIRLGRRGSGVQIAPPRPNSSRGWTPYSSL